MAAIPFKEFVSVYWRTWLVLLLPMLLAPTLWVASDPQAVEAMKCAYVILVMAGYWMTEALPLPITSMIPMVALPLLGIMSTSEVAINYLNSTNYMFLGGLIMAIAVEHCGLHNRIALRIIMMVGTSQARLMLGFMFTTMFLSMWISNTATTAMMLPIVDAVAEAINTKVEEKDEQNPLLAFKVSNTSEEVGDMKPAKADAGMKAAKAGVEAENDNYEASKKGEVRAPLASTDRLSDDPNMQEKDSFALISENTANSMTDQMTMTSLTASSHPGSNPDSMIEFLPNVRRNTATRIPSGDHSEKLIRRHTVARMGVRSEQGEKSQEIRLVNLQDTRFRKISGKSFDEEKCRLDGEGQSEDGTRSEDGVEASGKRVIINLPAERTETEFSSPREELERNFLLMSIAYSSNIGGTGVVTGTPPNLVVPEVLGKSFGPNTGLTFATWMAFSIPAMLVNLIIAWVWLQRLQSWYPAGRGIKRTQDQETRAMNAIKKSYNNLGKMTVHEIQVLVLFLALIGLWFFQAPLFMPGWGDLFDVKTVRGSKVSVASATPAILMCILLFILPQSYNFWPFVPVDRSLQNSASLISWRLIETKMCWGVIFLLGGGFALAAASQKSGLSSLMVEKMGSLNLSALPGWGVNLVSSLVTVTITNIASNTATANVVVPILSEMALTLCINPIYLTLPAGIICSYAFALPVSTAPNAIVFGHSTMKTADMMKAGMLLNLLCVLTLSLAINTYAVPLFALDQFPEWASARMENASLCQQNL